MLHIAHAPIYAHPLPEGHRFPMEKYDLLPRQLLHEGTCNEANFFAPVQLEDYEPVLAVHTPEYLQQLLDLSLERRAARKLGFPLSRKLVDRELTITQGTLDNCLQALEHGIAMNIAGGTHHAYSDHGEAFCLLNDQAIAAQWLLDQGKAKRILIVDLDVHQGNGTAEIFQEEERVFTFSMHGAGNYPFKKETSNLDIALPDGTGDAEYLKKLTDTLPRLLEEQQPDFVFYLCGVDILSTDKLGRLGCSVEGCKARDRYVLEQLKTKSIPVQCSMGGGYSPDIKVIVDAHANTFRLAQELYF
ncbi:histone deacetylase family protein [Croceiramulus getboli]|nr:histone deacetylase [Flavobacteriaceae bacterium YJPT1-3]